MDRTAWIWMQLPGSWSKRDCSYLNFAVALKISLVYHILYTALYRNSVCWIKCSLYIWKMYFTVLKSFGINISSSHVVQMVEDLPESNSSNFAANDLSYAPHLANCIV